MGWAPWPQPDQNQAQHILHTVHGIEAPIQQNVAQQEDVPLLIPLQPEPMEEIVINPPVPADLQNQDNAQVQQEEVLAMDDLTESDSEGVNQHAVLPTPPVEIAPFPDFNNLQPVIPLPEDEIQPDNLLGFDGLIGPLPEPVQQNIQIGMVHIAQPSVDPVFGNLSPLGPLPTLGPSSQALRYWVKFFSNHSSSSNSILILDTWMNFFSFLLL